MTAPTRRAALGAFASASVLAIPALAIAAVPSEPVHDLWAARHALRQPIVDAARALDDALNKMPWWARPGHSMLRHDGELAGEEVNWPAIQGMEPSPHREVFRLIRPGLQDIRWNYDFAMRVNPKSARALAIYRSNLRELATRRRAQREEERKAGLPAAQAAFDDLASKRADIERRIIELEPLTASVVAARILIEGNDSIPTGGNFYHAYDGELMVLEFVRPSLSGLLRAHVEEILDNPKTPMHLLQATLDRSDRRPA